ncbi:MAG TPA: glycosyltransferase [Longimicrobiales bacterium]|nr:glycosyltransferase [Longimicrobiales bacterium]
MRKFPVLSETFILNEILALEAKGLEVHIFPLAPTRDPHFHEGVGRLKATIHYVPGVEDLRALLRHARRQARRTPRPFLRQLLLALRTGKPLLLWRLLQAAYIADRAHKAGVGHLHAHFANRATTVARQASRMLGIPFSFTAHAFDVFRGADRDVIAGKMADARFTATVSDYNVRFLESLGNGQRPRIELIRNGIDMDRFAEPDRPPSGPFTILAVARLVEKKGLQLLIEACRILRERGREFRCDIVGKGALRAELERLIRQHDLRVHVHLIGPLTQQSIVQRYHGAHVLALPCIVGADGNREGLPVSIVEALACGVPVVSTPVTGIPEAVHHGVNGLLVPEGDAVGLADALERLMTDDALLQRLRQAARPSVVDEYRQERTSGRLLELFREALS